MSQPARCAIYARYSTDRQSPTSITDQVRKCREFAQRQGWLVLDAHIYNDKAISGAGNDRAGLQRLLQAATSVSRPFDCILVDDTSRLSRKPATALHLYEQLSFAGVRLVAVSQGVDSLSPQAELLFGVHGLIDSAYSRELGQKTHRGLEGHFLRRLHTGGRCFGYDIVEADGGKRLVVNEAEAAIVRRIFKMSADGSSLKTIAKTLNAEEVPTPRARKGRASAGWCPSAIREMLYNERYVGRVIWNRSRFVKVPGTNRRVARPRPPEEWHAVEVPELRIVSDELSNRVRRRLVWVKQTYGEGRPGGLVSRSASSPYLFSGLLVCSECGGKLTIVAGQGRGRHPLYGCPRNYNRGTCPNDIRERQDQLEARLLQGLQEAVLRPAAVDYALEQFEGELARQIKVMSAGAGQAQQREAELQAELGRLAEAVAASGHSPALLEAISDREKELQGLNDQLLGTGQLGQSAFIGAPHNPRNSPRRKPARIAA